jgi:putative PEP-CTERM system integral membrane protein
MGAEAVRWVGETLANLPRVLRDLGESTISMFGNAPLMLPFSVLGFLLLAYTATLFILAPIAVPYLSLRAWLKSLSQLVERLGWLKPALIAGGMAAASLGLFFLANQQPQRQVFAMLDQPPATLAEAQSLLDRSDSIRKGLLNAYLAPFRYISAEGEVVHVSDIYANTFRMPWERAYSVQRLYETFASPLLYKPVHAPSSTRLQDNRALIEEPQEAARLYQNFFDTPITVAELDTIVRSVRTTWSGDQAESAWQAVDDREVHLQRQEISLHEHGDWAEIELYEAYQNRTADQQEVVYYFNLPESAVLTGVWLGNSPDKSQAFSYQVAPRGAAQAVYREQTRIMKDPALLEQIGPRQYRLRVFPIPPLRITYNERTARSTVEEAPSLHLWLSWREMASGDAWPMPQLAFLRNVYWDDQTIRLQDGQPLQAGADDWLPASLPVSTPTPPQAAHRVDLPNGTSVLAVPASLSETPTLPDGVRIAVVIDRSYSMQQHAGHVAASLEQLRNITGLEQPVDVYLTASPYRGEDPSLVPLDALNEQELLYFGGQNAAQLLAQFDALRSSERSERPYDAVLVLTDSTGYELGASEALPPDTSAPIWVVHAGGAIPLGYDDQTLQAIQSSGGGVAASLDEALERIAVSINAESATSHPENPIVDQVDGYQWVVLPTGQAEAASNAYPQIQVHSSSDPFAALAARRLVLAEMQRQRGTINQVDTLDAIHALALEHPMVTPYSSMIVLVDAQQQAMLDRLSQQSDRYAREFEALGETTPGTPPPLVGVPEPHEWLLLGLAAALLIYLAYTRRERLQLVKLRETSWIRPR